MKLYSELEESIGMIINSMDETDTFKVRFEKLINNFWTKSSVSDLEDTINLSKVDSEIEGKQWILKL